MQYKRSARVGELIKQEISNILLRDLKDPRIGFVTITSIDLSDDLKNAKVYFSVLGDNVDKDASLAGIKHAASYIKRELGSRLSLRCIPELIFKLDESVEYGMKIDNILRKIKEEGGTEDSSGTE